jgi:hypothetical protein
MVGSQAGELSKGCLIALIVVGIIVVLVVVGFVLCYHYRADLGKMGAGVMMSGIKTEVAENPSPEVDTAEFNAIADGFMAKLNEEKELEAVDYQRLITTMQNAMQDERIDAEEVESLIEVMISFYPELAELRKVEEPSPPVEVDDTVFSH